MIGVGYRTRSSGFDFRGSNELARFSRLVWQQKVFRVGRIEIPLGPEAMHEEIVAVRGPTSLGVWMPHWGSQMEHGYQQRLAGVA